MTTEERKKSSASPSTNPPPPTSFSSLPNDLVLNILARISIIHRPTLSLVSKSFRSLIASPDHYATRSLIGKTEDSLYVCLDLNTLPRWFTLAPTPKQHKLIPIPLFNYQHPRYSTVVSIGSEIYVIGGFLKGKRSRRMLVLDCQSHQWSRLPKMRVPRQTPAAEVINGKIYVIGGCGDEHENIEHCGEVYDANLGAIIANNTR
ncbi:unnamed protein product [Arabis nemorensis]|uniref:F-box domain-containing protein n=1 Tax=Arabis nemorensis TaxID=586526 RepID=A0A565CH86_9BRAS|nr:unnamed protein product [Arabis nemorensis]